MPRLYDMVVGALRSLDAPGPPAPGARLLPQGPGARGLLTGGRRVRVVRRDERGLVAFDLVEGGVLCRSCRRGRSISPEALELVRRILGGGLAAALDRAGGPARRRGDRPGHRGHGGPSGPAPAQRALEPRRSATCPATAVPPASPATAVPPASGHDGGSEQFGVYVHVPFCASRCDYCAFATWTDRDQLMADYAAACATELRRAARDEALPAATSVFVGGGTPSRLPAELLGQVLDAVGHGARAPRSPSSATPRTPPRPASPRWRGRGGEPGVLRRTVHGPPRARAPRPSPRHHAGGPTPWRWRGRPAWRR